MTNRMIWFLIVAANCMVWFVILFGISLALQPGVWASLTFWLALIVPAFQIAGYFTAMLILRRIDPIDYALPSIRK